MGKVFELDKTANREARVSDSDRKSTVLVSYVAESRADPGDGAMDDTDTDAGRDESTSGACATIA